MAYKISRTKKVLPNSEFNTDSDGKAIPSDQSFKSYYHRPKGQPEVRLVKLTPAQTEYFRARFANKRDSRNRK